MPNQSFSSEVKKQLPADAINVWIDDGWTILVSRSQNSVHFVVTDYHAAPLKLTKRQLHELGKMASGRVKMLRKGKNKGQGRKSTSAIPDKYQKQSDLSANIKSTAKKVTR